jgi:hypothetical protein
MGARELRAGTSRLPARGGLVILFAAHNVLETNPPAFVSKAAPSARGLEAQDPHEPHANHP